ncbi:cytochrome b5-like Heme/Steroid binding domain-containing protein [Colletotrichum salicis]|uniref:Cytochrome b5-like Heme/Steroid binding domain-containing protein n=1 Tax=Colletotrichum salicis TaxID=1209931 RepID=A0A135UH93_9PEZI|nr:cytochrome b5-like Heme/Steroid binding domain-containing protein [Colletotrichum salicis]
MFPHDQRTDLTKTSPRNTPTSRFLFQAYAYLWLATLPARKKPTPFTDQTSRTKYPERLSIPKSAGGQEIIDLVTERERKQSAPTTQYLFNANIPTHDKEMCMANARLAFLRWEVLGDVSHEVAQGSNEDWRDVRRMIDQCPYNNGWLVFDFRDLPGMDLNDADLPSWAVAKPAIAPLPVPSRGKSVKVYSQLHHYHVGEIGDHQRVGSGAKWFVHKAHDDDRYLIYDFSGMQSKHGWDAITREQLTMRPGPYSFNLSRVLRVEAIDRKTCEMYMKNGPIGQVMQLMHTEDIRFANKRDALSCVAFGTHVFDLTNCLLPPHIKDLQVIIGRRRQAILSSRQSTEGIILTLSSASFDLTRLESGRKNLKLSQEAQRSPGVISPQEIVIRNRVFSKDVDISRFFGNVLDTTRDLLASKELDEYWGKDVTAQMDTADPPAILRTLLDSQCLIVAKAVVPRDTLPFMDDQCWAYLRYEKPDGFVELLKARAGKVLSNSAQDREVKRRLKSDFGHRIIAQHGPSKDADFDWKRSFRPIPSKVPAVTENGSSKLTPSLSFARAARKGNATMVSNQIVQPIQKTAGTKRKKTGQPQVQQKTAEVSPLSHFALLDQLAAGVKRKGSQSPVRPYKRIIMEPRGSAGASSSAAGGSRGTGSTETKKPT